MCYEEIAYKFPKAWDKYCKWLTTIELDEGAYFVSASKDIWMEIPYISCCESGEICMDLPFSIFYGLLLEFFDENKIIIIIQPHNCLKAKDFQVIVNAQRINPYGSISVGSNSFKTREEANLEAVKKAFEMLEERS